jgi:hypothetical protein
MKAIPLPVTRHQPNFQPSDQALTHVPRSYDQSCFFYLEIVATTCQTFPLLSNQKRLLRLLRAILQIETQRLKKLRPYQFFVNRHILECHKQLRYVCHRLFRRLRDDFAPSRVTMSSVFGGRVRMTFYRAAIWRSQHCGLPKLGKTHQ